MRIPREMLVIVVILAIAAVLTQQAAPDTNGQTIDLNSDSAEPGGAKALYFWLQSLGYAVERLEYQSFRPDDSARVMFVLAPSTFPDQDDLAALHRWVERGGKLIIAGDAPTTIPKLPINGLFPKSNALPVFLQEFNMLTRPLEAPISKAAPTQPLLLQPVVNAVRVETGSFITGTAEMVPYLGEQEHPVSASLMVGKGQVHVLASNYAFSNAGLGQDDNSKLLLNWLERPVDAGTVVFDEIHHGRPDDRSLTYVLVHEPWGWGALYTLGILFLYIALDGRRFGKAVPSIVDTRRVAGEYVSSLAGLLRRGRKATWAAEHYEHILRRELAAYCDLDPTLGPTALGEWVSHVDHLTSDISGKRAGQVLLELHLAADNGISEKRLVELAAETSRIIIACGGKR